MLTRVSELGSLAFAIAFLATLGFGIILRGLDRARYVARTASSAYSTMPMQVLKARLAPLDVDGATMATDSLSAKTSMLVVSYGYRVEGRAYVSDAVFPMEIEWLRPRVSAFRLLDDIESGRLQTCHVDRANPSRALLFTGWSPYLWSHVLGISGSGLLLVVLAGLLWWFV